jgi:hypothetical protein
MSSSSEQYSDINIIEHFAYGNLTSYGAIAVDKRNDILFICPNNFEEKGMSYFAYCVSVVTNGGIIANEKFRANSLNPEFDFDFLNAHEYSNCTPNELMVDHIKRLGKPQKAFYCFISNLQSEIPGKIVFLMKSDLKVKTFEIVELKNDMPFNNNLEKWLTGVCRNVYTININPEVLNEDREYRIVLNVKQELDALLATKQTNSLIENANPGFSAGQ